MPEPSSKMAMILHYRHVTRDPEYLDAVRAIRKKPNRSAEEYAQLEKDWGIDISKIPAEEIALNQLIFSGTYTENSTLSIDEKTGSATLQFNIKTVKSKDFKTVWHRASKKRDELFPGTKQRRNTPPFDDNLIYALWKERQKNLSWKEIYKKYEQHDLYDDHRITKRNISGEDALSAYFRDHFHSRR